MTCPDELQVAAYLESGAGREAIERHVDDCDACRETLAATVAVSGAPRMIGRYRLERVIGSGGMGVVSEAWDPALQRRVAIKLLHPEVAGELLLREARALATLQHPNVVAVFDVGEIEGDVFIATELVDGEPLGHWQVGRSSREIIGAYAQAARGLLAAHRAGLVHRDVKPSNILVSRDGRARIGDFGLARAHGDAGDGQIVGTPAYMAPEQRLGKPVDERADQYSLCLALAEALLGTKPGAPAQLPKHAPWPAIARGLAESPAQRFPTLEPLITALEGRPPARARYVVAGGVALIGAVAIFAWGHDRGPACRDREPLAIDHRGIHAAFHATKLAYADDAARIATSALDTYATSFAAEDARACAAANGSAHACLGRIRGQVAQLVSALAGEPDALTIQRAPAAVRGLPDPAICRSNAEHTVPSDPALAARMTEMSTRLGNAATLRRLGKPEAARTVAQAVLAEALAAGLWPAIAESRHELGTILHAIDDPGAERMLLDALAAAANAHADLEAAQIAALLVEVIGRRGDVAAAERQAALARSANIRAGSDRFVEAVVERGLGFANNEANQRPAALAHYQRAETLHRAIGALDDVTFDQRAQVIALGSLDRIDEAAKLNALVLAFDREHLGPMHPRTIGDLAARGQLEFRAGHLAESARAFETAVELDAKVLAADSPQLASLRGQLGGVYMTMGRIAEAEPLFRETVRVLAKTRPAADDELRGQRMNLAGILIMLGRHREAVRDLEVLGAAVTDPDLRGLVLETLAQALIGDRQAARAVDAAREALVLATKVYGASSRRGAQAHTTIGNALALAKQPAAAVTEFERAIRMYEASVDATTQELGEPLTGLAEILLARGDAKRARELLERAVELRADSDPVDLAASQFALGRALHALHDPAAAAHVTKAVDLWRGAGARADARRATAEAWLRSR